MDRFEEDSKMLVYFVLYDEKGEGRGVASTTTWSVNECTVRENGLPSSLTKKEKSQDQKAPKAKRNILKLNFEHILHLFENDPNSTT